MFLNTEYMIFMIIAFGLSLVGGVISSRLRGKFNLYSKKGIRSGMSGAEIAQSMLQHYNIHDVRIVQGQGFLTDHYNPANKTVNLSPEVYNGRNAAAAAVASHECGHAVQHATAYSFLQFRSAMVPVQNISGNILNFIILASFLGGGFGLVFFGTSLIETILSAWSFLLYAVYIALFVVTYSIFGDTITETLSNTSVEIADAFSGGASYAGYNIAVVSYLSLASDLSTDQQRSRTIAIMWFMMIVPWLQLFNCSIHLGKFLRRSLVPFVQLSS